jgi:hypothetical protein
LGNYKKKGWQGGGEELAGSVQFEFRISQGVIPKRPRFYQRAEGSPMTRNVVAGDPSLRLKNGCTQDDASDDDQRCPLKFKLHHYQLVSRVDWPYKESYCVQ